MKSITLVIMAAGIGSRFGGGIKQLEPVGPDGEILMDYSIKDALEAGFNRVVFIIRKDLEKDFKEMIGNRIEKLTEVAYAFQETEDIPEPFRERFSRKKPWGTGQAVLSLKGLIDGPFAVINADDYYGEEAFRKLHAYMTEKMDTQKKPYDLCMAGFILANTLSENGGVTRGICQVSPDGDLIKVEETYDLKQTGELVTGQRGREVKVSPDSVVSMNMWGLSPAFAEELEQDFYRFLSGLSPNDESSEYLIPQIIDRFLKEKKVTVKVLGTGDRWFGMTYREDVETVKNELKKLSGRS